MLISMYGMMKSVDINQVQVLQSSDRERKLSPAIDKDDDVEIRVSHSCHQMLRRSDGCCYFGVPSQTSQIDGKISVVVIGSKERVKNKSQSRYSYSCMM